MIGWWHFYVGVRDDAPGGNPRYISNGQPLASDITVSTNIWGGDCYAAGLGPTGLWKNNNCTEEWFFLCEV